MNLNLGLSDSQRQILFPWPGRGHLLARVSRSALGAPQAPPCGSVSLPGVKSIIPRVKSIIHGPSPLPGVLGVQAPAGTAPQILWPGTTLDQPLLRLQVARGRAGEACWVGSGVGGVRLTL